MYGNGSLGNDDLLIGDDPFISGATYSHDNYNLLNDDWCGDSLFDTETSNSTPSPSEQEAGDDFEDLFSLGNYGDYGNMGDSSDLMFYNQFAGYTEEPNFSEQADHVEASDVESVQQTTGTNQVIELTEGPKPETTGNSNNGVEHVEAMTSRMKIREPATVTRRVSTTEPTAVNRTVPQNIRQQRPPLPIRMDGTNDTSHLRLKYFKSSATGYQPVYFPTVPAQQARFPVKVLPIHKNKIRRNHPYKQPFSQQLAEKVRQVEQLHAEQVQEPRPGMVAQPSLNSPNENIADEWPQDQTDELGGGTGSQPVEVAKPQASRMDMVSLIPRDKKSNLITCGMCAASFNTKLGLEFHELEKHACVYAFGCSGCNKKFSTLKVANQHLIFEHNFPMIPMYDKAILGNGLEGVVPRQVQRRISGMISSFLNRHLAKLGLMTGNPLKDYNLVKLYTKKLCRPLPVNFKVNCPDKSAVSDPQAVEIANLNEMLNKEFIYGPSIYRIGIQYVNADSIISKIANAPEEEEEQPVVQDDMDTMDTYDSGPMTVQQVPVYSIPPKRTFVVPHPPQHHHQQQQQQQQTQQRSRVEDSPNYRYTLNKFPVRINSNYPEDQPVYHPEKEEYSTTGGRKLYKVRTVARKVPVNQNLQPSSSQYYNNYQ